MKRRAFVAGSATAIGTTAWWAQAGAHERGWRAGSDRSSNDGLRQASSAYGPANSPVVRQWNAALCAAMAATATDPTVSSRAIAMVYEAVYNAWAIYHPQSSFTLGGIRRAPWWLHTPLNKRVALSHAAHAVLVDLFPSQQARFDAQLDTATSPIHPAWVDPAARDNGLAAAAALLAMRHADGSNQLGDLAPGAYADYTGYQPVNSADRLVDPARWQPLHIINLAGQAVVQKCLTPHWGRVKPFALPSGSALRPDMGPLAPTAAELDEVVSLNAELDDNTKATVDFWAANPGSVTPAGMWTQIAEMVAARDGHGLDEDVRMYFALGQAVLDAGIACWDAKRAYDSARPITAVRHYLRGQRIRAWGGPGQGTVSILAENWWPYQRYIRPSPPFAEFPSGHSSFSAAAATVLAGLRGSDRITLSFTFGAGKVPFDPTVPARDVTLVYPTLSAAADGAGYSRRQGGIHFRRGDLHGRAIGRRAGQLVLARVKRLFDGR